MFVSYDPFLDGLIALAILAVEALFAALWFKAFRYGPLEWLWRWATYGKRPA